MLAAIDRYVTELKSVDPPPSGTSPLIRVTILGMVAVTFLAGTFQIYVAPLGAEDFEFLLNLDADALFWTCLLAFLAIFLLLKWERKRHPDGLLTRLGRSRGVKLWAFALGFWLRSFRWLLALILALWAAGLVAPALSAFLGQADQEPAREMLERVITFLQLFTLVWITKARITRRLASPEAA